MVANWVTLFMYIVLYLLYLDIYLLYIVIYHLNISILIALITWFPGHIELYCLYVFLKDCLNESLSNLKKIGKGTVKTFFCKTRKKSYLRYVESSIPLQPLIFSDPSNTSYIMVKNWMELCKLKIMFPLTLISSINSKIKTVFPTKT